MARTGVILERRIPFRSSNGGRIRSIANQQEDYSRQQKTKQGCDILSHYSLHVLAFLGRITPLSRHNNPNPTFI
jgi:hypothetical protein